MLQREFSFIEPEDTDFFNTAIFRFINEKHPYGLFILGKTIKNDSRCFLPILQHAPNTCFQFPLDSFSYEDSHQIIQRLTYNDITILDGIDELPQDEQQENHIEYKICNIIDICQQKLLITTRSQDLHWAKTPDLKSRLRSFITLV